ncbi:hypothetical protein ACVGVM_04885 [Pseudonocardia bannensis]
MLGLERVVTDMLCRDRPQDALAVADQALARIDASHRDGFRSRIRQRLDERPDPRGTRFARHLLGLATGRAESPAESWLLWVIVDLGFPIPEVNWSIRGVDGREIYRVDLAWPALRIAVEYNGYSAHAERTADDEARVRDLRKRGWIVLVVEADDLRSPARVELELHAAFVSRGWDLRQRSVGTTRRRRHRDSRAS